jgi:hypothetical protein
MPSEREWHTAMRLLERLAYPSGSWRDDEAKRLARLFIKKQRGKTATATKEKARAVQNG